MTPVTKIDIIKETMSCVRISANNGMGQPASKKAMEMAIAKAKKTGIGMAVVGQSNHFGIAGYYALMAAKEGLIGMCGTNARPSVAPTWGVEPMLGTNPFTIAIPTDMDYPWVADQATSIIQRGKVEVASRVNKPMTPGWVININGETETDASKVLIDMTKGLSALTPLGGIGEQMSGYKGYNYCVFVEMMSACMSQANFLKATLGANNAPYNLGHFFIAVDPSAFVDLKEFKKAAGDICRGLQNSKKMPGAEKIYVAGEKEHLAWLKREKGGIPLPEVTQREMLGMIQDLKLTKYKFDFKVDMSKKSVTGW
jgi:LDH2 family malate/lactate/ureidoglycolate dehydrogenase